MSLNPGQHCSPGYMCASADTYICVCSPGYMCAGADMHIRVCVDCSPGYVCASADMHMCVCVGCSPDYMCVLVQACAYEFAASAPECGLGVTSEEGTGRCGINRTPAPSLLLVGLSHQVTLRTEPLPAQAPCARMSPVEQKYALSWGTARQKWQTGLPGSPFEGRFKRGTSLESPQVRAAGPGTAPPLSREPPARDLVQSTHPQAMCSFLSRVLTQSGYRRDTYVHTCTREQMNRFSDGLSLDGWLRGCHSERSQ